MFEAIILFLEAGGKILWVIFFVLFSMWFFIFERFYYFYKIHSQKKQKIQESWMKRKDKNSWFALRVREEEISKMNQNINRFVPQIQILVLISPLLGLTGTVNGMISIFDTISVFGTGNPRLMASGISLAVIPTMAGLVTALSGLYFVNYLKKKCEAEKQIFSESLRF